MIKRLAWPLVSIIALAGVILVAALLRQLGEGWSAAIQGTATIVLVIVTSIYAYSTYRLVDAQEQGPTRSAQVAALAQVLTVAHRKGSLPSQIGDHLKEDLEEMTPELHHHLAGLLEQTEELRDQLIEQVILLPDPLYDDCWDAIWKVWYAGDVGRAVLNVISIEGEAALQEPRPFDIDNLRSIYYSDFRADLEERPEWEELTDGSYFGHASDHLGVLVLKARDYVVESRKLR